MITQKEVKKIKDNYPVGTKVKLIKMNDPYPVPPGTIGTIMFVDDSGQIHVKWGTGSSLSLILGDDEFDIFNN